MSQPKRLHPFLWKPCTEWVDTGAAYNRENGWREQIMLVEMWPGPGRMDQASRNDYTEGVEYTVQLMRTVKKGKGTRAPLVSTAHFTL